MTRHPRGRRRPVLLATLQVPAIIDPSPYYTTIGRGNAGEHITDIDGDGINDVWPLYVDNYFVPRGYAVILAHMNGTGFSTGCPMHGGPGDIASMRVVIDWLQGRVVGHDGDGDVVTADWHNGKAAMIGKSYDGTLANGVAATGVDGLTTIVPEHAISDWYRYSRTNGIRHNTHYPSGLANTVTDDDRKALCSSARGLLNLQDGDDSGDVNAFWLERDYTQNVSNITASVFAVQGLNDDNVEMDQFGDYWAALAAHDVPRKVWLMKVGHIDLGGHPAPLVRLLAVRHRERHHGRASTTEPPRARPATPVRACRTRPSRPAGVRARLTTTPATWR